MYVCACVRVSVCVSVCVCKTFWYGYGHCWIEIVLVVLVFRVAWVVLVALELNLLVDRTRHGGFGRTGGRVLTYIRIACFVLGTSS